MFYLVSILLVHVAVSASAASLKPKDFECPGLGIFPDPDDCQAFYMCSPAVGDEHYERFVCPASYLFDDLLLVCNYDYAVDCGDRPLPGSTTKTTPTTTMTPTTTTTTCFSTPSKTTTTQTTTVATSETTTATTTVSTTVTTTDTTTVTSTDTTTVTTTDSTTTTTHTISGGRFPDKAIGIYLTLADDTEDGFHTDADWEPQLFEYQQTGANVLFFTFVNPETMVVPKAFQKLAATRGKTVEGAVPKDTKIIFAIGGYAYSIIYNPWHWLTSKEAAEAMAEEVATWPDRYGCDGIDLDIEDGAGANHDAGPNMVHFVKRLRQLKPDIIVGQPAYGFPQVPAETDVINASWNVDSSSNNVADSVGLMVYEGTEALRYVDNYAKGAEQWEGFPVKVNVPRSAIMLGCKGTSSASDISTMADESIKQDLLGIMVWFASVKNGLHYEISWDASTSEESQTAYINAMKLFNAHLPTLN